MIATSATDFSSYSQLAWVVTTVALVELAVTGLIVKLAPKGVVDKMYFASCIISPPMTWIMFYYAVRGTLETRHDPQTRVFGASFNTNLFQVVYVAHSVCCTITESMNSGLSIKTLPLVLHHVTSITAYTFALHTQRFGFFSCAAGLCEITNSPLSLLYLSKTKGGGVAEAIESALGLLLTFNGFILWLSFIIFRIILLPVVEYYIITDVWRGITHESRGTLYSTELIYYPLVIAFIWCLSCVWFSKINAGFVKVLNGAKVADASPEKAE